MEESWVTMPKNAEVIRVDDEDQGAIFIWARVDTDEPLVDRRFFLYKTGGEHRSPKSLGFTTEPKYLGCGAIFVQMELMMYVFEFPNDFKKHIPVVNDFDWKKVQESPKTDKVWGDDYYRVNYTKPVEINPNIITPKWTVS